jgi:hypothetical protein
LEELYWRDRNYNVASVDLLGAAVNPYDVSKQSMQRVIEDLVGFPTKFDNQYCPFDNMLQAYLYKEGHKALGSIKLEGILPTPENYQDVYVCDQIHSEENHMRYMGIVNPYTKELIEDGAMDRVVDDWR